MDAGRWSVASALAAALCLDVVLWFTIVANDHRSFALRLGFVAGMLGKAFPILVCVSAPTTFQDLTMFMEVLFGAPLKTAMGTAVPNLAIVLVLLASRPFMPGGGRPSFSVPALLQSGVAPRFEAFLIFAGFINLSDWVANLQFFSLPSFVLRALSSALVMVPFFVGYTAFQLKRATYCWLGVFALNLVGSVLTGSRGSAFYPIGFFTVGLLMGLPTLRARIRFSLLILAPVGAVLVVLAIYIRSVRDVVGRTDIREALQQGSAVSREADRSDSGQFEYRGSALFQAASRLTIWPTLVVPVATPDPIAYRGFDDLAFELRSAVGFGALAARMGGGTYIGNMHLKPYGFAVHLGDGGQLTSSVEFPVWVDGFTRGGWLTSLAYTVIAFAALFATEAALRAQLRPYPFLFFAILTVLCYIAFFRFGISGLIASLRQLILQTVFCLVVFHLFNRVMDHWTARR